MRIRSIKPEFWTSQSNGRLTRNARLIFVGLWSVSDNFGRFRADPRMLAGALLPYDRDGVAVIKKSLDELASEGKIELFTFERSRFGAIPAWAEHQWMKRRGSPIYPDPRDPKSIAIPARSLSEPDPETVRQGQGIGDRGQGLRDRDQGSGDPDRDQEPDDQQPELPGVPPAAAPAREPNEHVELYRIFQKRRRARLVELGEEPTDEEGVNMGRVVATISKWRPWFKAHEPAADSDRWSDLTLALVDAYLADDWGAGASPAKYPFAAFSKPDYWQRLAAQVAAEIPF